MDFEFHVPSHVYYGGGSRRRAGEVARKAGVTHALLVTDVNLVNHPMFADVVDSLAQAGIRTDTFSGIDQEPTDTIVNAAFQAFRDHGCDGVVSFGGGSCIDTAKTVSCLATNDVPVSAFQGYHKVANPGIPHVAVPTTAGTGSEVTRTSIISDTARDVKMMCLDNSFITAGALVDYETTFSMPADLTAYVGLDALTHAIEGYVSRKRNPVSDSLALAAIAKISAHLRRAWANPDDVEARENMMHGSTMAGMAFSNASVCTVHGMSRPIGAFFHAPHGLSNAFLLPAVTAYSLSGDPARYAKIAETMGIDRGSRSDEAMCDALVEALRAFNADLKVPTIRAWGVDADAFFSKVDTMIEAAIDSGSPANNPRILEKDEMKAIYREAFGD